MFLSDVGIGLLIYERGASGVPGTTQVASIQHRIDSYEHTVAKGFGFETMRCAFAAELEEALDWLSNGLMRTVVVIGPQGEIVWEGFLETVQATLGGEVRSVSLRDMANRLRVRYTTVLGTPGTTATASDTASQALYGIKDSVLPLAESDATEAGEYRDAMLARLKDPRAGPSATVATGEFGEVRLSLEFTGWYATLDWVLTSSTSTTKTSTTTQVGTLLTNIAAVNAFISTSTSNIVSSGITATEFIELDTPYRVKTESLLARGNGVNVYAWGVYENREFYADVWAAAAPSTIHYRRYLDSGEVYDPAGGIVNPWNVRPDRMYEVVDLLDPAAVSTQQNAAARFYVARVTCTVSGDTVGVTLEPEESTDLAAVLITKYV